MKKIEYMGNGSVYVEADPVRESTVHLEAYSRKMQELAARKETENRETGRKTDEGRGIQQVQEHGHGRSGGASSKG